MSKKLNSLQELAASVHSLQGPIAVFAHIRPDGDAIGSSVGLVELLRSLGKDAFLLVIDPLPARLSFLSKDIPQKTLTPQTPDILSSSTLVALDSSALKLIEPIGAAPIALAIDHHLSHTPYATEYFVDLNASSTAQIIAELARYLKANLSPAGVAALYAGVLTDTGRFAWGNEGENFARTFETAAWLIRQGAPAKDLADTLTRTITLPYLKLQALALERLLLFNENQLAIIPLSIADFASVGCPREDKDLLLAMFQSIAGVQMMILIMSEPGEIRLSARARHEATRADLFCAQFGGGGHRAAAGAVVKTAEPLQEFLPRLKEKLLLHYSSYGPSSRVV